MDSGTGPVAAVVLDPTATLRPTGIGRYFTAAFLGIWLLGWAVGVVVAICDWLLSGLRLRENASTTRGEIVDCARWFASRTGFELQLWK